VTIPFTDPGNRSCSVEGGCPLCSWKGIAVLGLIAAGLLAYSLLTHSGDDRSAGAAAPATSAPIVWLSSLDEAKAQAAEAGRPILLSFTDPTRCPPCRAMESKTWPDVEVARVVADRFVAVKLVPGMHDATAAAREYGVSAIPTMIIADADGTPRARSTGYRDPRSLIAWLEEAG
jgi:thiol:disulfide interchange protein